MGYVIFYGILTLVMLTCVGVNIRTVRRSYNHCSAGMLNLSIGILIFTVLVLWWDVHMLLQHWTKYQAG